MDHRQLEEIGEALRGLGHERRRTVEQIVAEAESAPGDARQLYAQLDRISEQAINLMERQRALIRDKLNG